MEPIVYHKGNFPIDLIRANAYIAFRVGWNDGVQKFNVFEQRSFGWRTNNTTSGVYDTFAEAYAAAEAAARELCTGNTDIAILAVEDNARDLIGSWGMSQTQIDELVSFIPAQTTEQEIKSSVQISSSNGTRKVIDNLTKAWRALHEAYLGISEINEGSWKQGQKPICFTTQNSPELAASIKDLNQVFDKLIFASNAKMTLQYLPDELVVRLAHYAGEMEAKKQIDPPEWDDLFSAIRDAMDRYYADPNETNPFHIEDVAEQVFTERFPAGEGSKRKPKSIQLPDGSTICVCYNEGQVNGHEQDKRTWQSLDIQHLSSDGQFLNNLCSVDFEDGAGLRTTIHNPAKQEDPVFQYQNNISNTENHPLELIIRNAEIRTASNKHQCNMTKEDQEL